MRNRTAFFVLVVAACSGRDQMALRRLTIQDASGRARIEFVGDDGGSPAIRMLDESGATRMSIRPEEGGMVIEMQGADSEPSLQVVQNSRGAAVIFFGNGGEKRAFLGAGGDGAILAMNSGALREFMVTASCSEEGSSLEVAKLSGKACLAFAAAAATPSITIQDGRQIQWKAGDD